jgi:hypothetical protein
MRRRAEEQKLGQPESEDAAESRRLSRQRPFQRAVDERVDLAKPSERRRGEIAGKRPVAGGQPEERRMIGDRLVERALSRQHRFKDVERDPTGRRLSVAHRLVMPEVAARRNGIAVATPPAD